MNPVGRNREGMQKALNSLGATRTQSVGGAPQYSFNVTPENLPVLAVALGIELDSLSTAERILRMDWGATIGRSLSVDGRIDESQFTAYFVIDYW